MKKLSKNGILLKATVVFLIIFLVIGCSKRSAKFQRDTDIVRLRHLKYYGELFQEYHAATGKYPFEHIMPMTLCVYVANDKQVESTKNQTFSGPYGLGPFSLFVKQIESVLGRPVDEYYDPQDEAVYKPSFYLYMIHNDTFYFTVYIHRPYPFAKKVDEHYYEVTISNRPDPENYVYDPDELFSNSKFNDVIDETLSRKGFFKERENEHLHYTKLKTLKEVPVPNRDIL